jgi:quercetin dioxygenase-like cupin family protein
VRTPHATVSPHAAVPGERQVVILQGIHTNQTLSLVVVIDLPRCGAPLHVHTLEDETFHVLDGEYEIQVDEHVVRAGPGVTVFGSRQHPHTYRYLGETGVGRMVTVFTPSGIEDLLDDSTSTSMKESQILQSQHLTR